MIKAMNTIPVTDDNGFLFNVDILVKSPSNALALQYLLEMLNDKAEVVDFRIKSGMELGEIINTLVQAKKDSVISNASRKMASSTTQHEKPAPPAISSPEKRSLQAHLLSKLHSPEMIPLNGLKYTVRTIALFA